MLQRRGLLITATIDAEFERRRHRRSVHDVSQSSRRRRHLTRDVTTTAYLSRAVSSTTGKLTENKEVINDKIQNN